MGLSINYVTLRGVGGCLEKCYKLLQGGGGVFENMLRNNFSGYWVLIDTLPKKL